MKIKLYFLTGLLIGSIFGFMPTITLYASFLILKYAVKFLFKEKQSNSQDDATVNQQAHA